MPPVVTVPHIAHAARSCSRQCYTDGGLMSEPKRFSTSTVVVISAIVGAAAFAAGRSMHDGASGSSASTAAVVSEPPIATTTSTSTALPPGHPPVESPAATTVLPATAPAASGEHPLSWKVPAKWQVVPNTSTMRLATYRVGADAEMAVSQAGGAVDANVERWIGQFGPDAKKSSKVTTKKVAGLDVTIVEVEGTYGGMGMGSPGSGAKESWALLGAIVATPGMPHFFKLTGPAKTVKAARPELDELLASLAAK